MLCFDWLSRAAIWLDGKFAVGKCSSQFLVSDLCFWFFGENARGFFGKQFLNCFFVGKIYVRLPIFWDYFGLCGILGSCVKIPVKWFEGSFWPFWGGFSLIKKTWRRCSAFCLKSTCRSGSVWVKRTFKIIFSPKFCYIIADWLLCGRTGRPRRRRCVYPIIKCNKPGGVTTLFAFFDFAKAMSGSFLSVLRKPCCPFYWCTDNGGI